MKIPSNLPQFKDSPSLLLTSGEFEAKFYVARNGEISETGSFVLNPREEAKEKQAFVGKKGGMQSLSAVSHHGRYIEDLKNKFLRKLRTSVDDISEREQVVAIHIFAPTHAEKRICEKLSQKSKDKVIHAYAGHYYKESPLRLLEMIQGETEIASSPKNSHLSKEEKNIIRLPNTKPKK